MDKQPRIEFPFKDGSGDKKLQTAEDRVIEPPPLKLREKYNVSVTTDDGIVASIETGIENNPDRKPSLTPRPPLDEENKKNITPDTEWREGKFPTELIEGMKIMHRASKQVCKVVTIFRRADGLDRVSLIRSDGKTLTLFKRNVERELRTPGGTWSVVSE